MTTLKVLEEAITSLPITDPPRQSDDYDQGLADMKDWVLKIIKKSHMTKIPSVEEGLTENLIDLIMQDIKWHEEATAPSQFIEAMSPDKAFIAGLTQAVFLIEKAQEIIRKTNNYD